MNEAKCPVCGEIATIKRIARVFGQDNDLIVIENIPIIMCRKCHEHYITAETLHEIEQLREQRQHQSRTVHVERCAA